MFLAYVTLAALLWQTPASSSNAVAVKDNEIWVQTASGQRQLTHDGIPKRLPTLSPSGNAVAYVVDHPVPQNAPQETIVLLDLDGEVRQRIVPEGYVPGEFERLDWLDDQRIGAMTCGHANCMYWVINPGSGKTIEVMRGGFEYTWSHNRQFVATWNVFYDCDDPREREKGCPEHDSVSLNPGGTYPPEWAGKNSDRSHSHDIGTSTPTFFWSPDDKWVAFTDLIGPEDDWYVVILSPDGKMLRDTVPIDPDFHSRLEWLDNTHLDLRAGNRVFHFAIDKGAFSEMCPAKQ